MLFDLPPNNEPLAVYPVELVTCLQFAKDTPELVHHSVRTTAINRSGAEPCAACGQVLPPDQNLYSCAICRDLLCAACLAKDGYAPEDNRFMVADLERREFLVRETKEQAFNVQGGECAQCRRPLAGIEEAAIMRGDNGTVLLCDYPCANQALGQDQIPPPGSYPTDYIRIVADPRHGEPQDWLNVHYELGMPKESNEVWAQADCRFAAAIQADPARWEFIAECFECGRPAEGYAPRPHKWHQVFFFLTEKALDPPDPIDPSRPEPLRCGAQDLLFRLSEGRANALPGVKIIAVDPSCLEYYDFFP